MIAIVDYGMGNPGSILNMFKRLGFKAAIVAEPERILAADKIVLPGVGAFDAAMSRINATGLRAVLDRKAAEENVPILGICLGMQLLTRGSEEGKLPGLGWIPADTKRFPALPGLKVPHMGWNAVQVSAPSPLTEGFAGDERFYFVHSYHAVVDAPEHSILKARHGVEFDAAIRNAHIYGVQFHPEKSHRFGMKLLANFARI